jgi:hypothetical protein
MTLTDDRLSNTSAVTGYVWSLAAALLASMGCYAPTGLRYPRQRWRGFSMALSANPIALMHLLNLPQSAGGYHILVLGL